MQWLNIIQVLFLAHVIDLGGIQIGSSAPFHAVTQGYTLLPFCGSVNHPQIEKTENNKTWGDMH